MNREMVDLDVLDDEDVDWLRGIITLHLEVTGSAVAERLLSQLVAATSSRSRRSSRRTTSACSKPQRDAVERGVDVDEASHGGGSWVRRRGS